MTNEPRFNPGQRVDLRLDRIAGTNSGTLATVVRQLGPDEVDEVDVGRMYELRLHVFEYEIQEEQ